METINQNNNNQNNNNIKDNNTQPTNKTEKNMITIITTLKRKAKTKFEYDDLIIISIGMKL